MQLDQPRIKRSTFHKMKVVGPRSAVMTAPVTDTLANADPTASAIAKTNKDMATALADADTANKRAGRKRPRKQKTQIAPSSAVAIYDACLQRLRALKSRFDETYNPLVRLLSQRAAASAAAAPITGLTAATSDDVSAGTEELRRRVLDTLPRQYHRKYGALHTYMASNPSAIRVARNGQVVIDGKEISGSAFVDIIRSFYVWRKPAVEMPTGASDVLGALRAVGVPEGALSSAAARELYSNMAEDMETDTETETFTDTQEDMPLTVESPSSSKAPPPLPPASTAVASTSLKSASTTATAAMNPKPVPTTTATTMNLKPVSTTTTAGVNPKPATTTTAATLNLKPAAASPGQKGQGRAVNVKWPGVRPEVLYLYKP